MSLSLRPLLGRLPWPNLFASLALVASLAACSDIADSSFETEGPAESRGTPALSASRATCAPDVLGLSAKAIEPIKIACPIGYTQRKTFSAMPIAGRFTNATELRDAFCVEKESASLPRPPTPNLDVTTSPSSNSAIDFEKNDVVIYAFDTRNGEKPALFERGSELWLRTTTACGNELSELGSIAFTVAKAQRVNEQKCAAACGE
jgi:hypothetical protein